LIFLNGEGVLGLVLGTCLIYWFIKQFKKDESGTRKTIV
jgi:hypothetical protein